MELCSEGIESMIDQAEHLYKCLEREAEAFYGIGGYEKVKSSRLWPGPNGYWNATLKCKQK